jgi:hypothetical protein
MKRRYSSSVQWDRTLVNVLPDDGLIWPKHVAAILITLYILIGFNILYKNDNGIVE